MSLLAIDPGTSESAYLEVEGCGLPEMIRFHRCGIVENNELLRLITWEIHRGGIAAIEMVASYGMPVGREVFETCVFIGRLMQVLENRDHTVRLIYRRDVKMFLCGSARAKDGNIRQALIDKYGAPGTKKQKGRLYGISSHLWAALAVADYALNKPEIETERWQ